MKCIPRHPGESRGLSPVQQSAARRARGLGPGLRRGYVGVAFGLFMLVVSSTVSAREVDPCKGNPDGCIVVADKVTSDANRPDIVVTATGARQQIGETGQAVTVLTRDAIERRQLPVLSDLLATTPGVTVSRNGGIGQPTAVRIRGAEGEQTLVLIDGVRVNDPSSPGGAFDFGNLLVGKIDRVEVLRGPNSVPWGSQALGGVVNITTARPGPGLGAELHGEYGYKNAGQVVARVSDSFGPVAASLGGGYFTDDGVSAFKFGTERDGYRQYAGSGRVEVTLSPDVSIDLRGNYADSKVAFDGFPPPNFTFADTSGYGTTKQAFGYAGLNATLGALHNRLAFTLSDTRRRSYTTTTAAAALFNGRTERYEYQGDASLADTISAVFGAEHEDSRFDDGKTNQSTGVTSGYLQAIVTPFERLTLTGGARIDDHRTYGTKTTFSGNAALRIGSATVLRASYGEGFKAPTLFQLFSVYGNTALQPETAQSFDGGIEQALVGGALRFGATYFHRDTVNQIDFSFAPRVGRPFGFYDNIARTRAEGVEAFIELRPTPELTFAANYTYTDAKNRATDVVLLRRPEHSVNASIDWTPRRWLRFGASVQTVSDSRDNDFRTFAPASLDGYTLVGVRASVPLGDRFELYGRVENLTDASYETVSGYGTYGRNGHIGVRVRL